MYKILPTSKLMRVTVFILLQGSELLTAFSNTRNSPCQNNLSFSSSWDHRSTLSGTLFESPRGGFSSLGGEFGVTTSNVAMFGSKNGYNNDDVTSSDSEEDDQENESDALDVDVITDDFKSPFKLPRKSAKVTNYNPEIESMLQSNRQSYKLASFLWLSLAFDVIFNKSKRLLLFQSTNYLNSFQRTCLTSNLACGFTLAAGCAYILSREETKHDPSEDIDYTLEFSQRKKLHLLLSAFGILNLCAHFNLSSAAPYLGMGGAVINIHNSLIATNVWRKERQSLHEINPQMVSSKKGIRVHLNKVMSVFKSLLGTSSSGIYKNFTSSLYMVAVLIALLRSTDVVYNSIIPYYSSFLGNGQISTVTMDGAKEISLLWAFLARMSLAGGLCFLLKEENDKGGLNFEKKTGMFRELNGLVSLCALLAAIPPLLLGSKGYEGILLDAFKLLLFGLFTGYSYVASRR